MVFLLSLSLLSSMTNFVILNLHYLKNYRFLVSNTFLVISASLLSFLQSLSFTFLMTYFQSSYLSNNLSSIFLPLITYLFVISSIGVVEVFLCASLFVLTLQR